MGQRVAFSGNVYNAEECQWQFILFKFCWDAFITNPSVIAGQNPAINSLDFANALIRPCIILRFILLNA